MSRPIYAQINLAALRHNLAQVRALTLDSRVFAVIKANGYGHGIVRVAKQLASADGFAVASLDEALILRQNGFLHRILLLEGAFQPDELSLIEQHRLDLVVHSPHQVDWLLDYQPKSPLKIWFKIDTGMHRLGFDLVSFSQSMLKIRNALPKLKLNLMSHFASVTESQAFTDLQLETFNQACIDYNLPKSIANSAAIQRLPQTHFDWVRPGIMLYGAGIDPSLQSRFKAVLTFKTQLISLKWIAEGETVGYGQTWTAPRRSLIGVAAAGYGDGYPRHAPNGTPVLVNGQRVLTVGRVSMDMITLDLTDMSAQVAIGDPVTLWGEGLGVDEVAEKAGTIGYELLCGITQRVPIQELDSEVQDDDR
ncbi:alanine racemase [Thiomicrospira sp. R3]|uniref:alanine racemase n=1 Tax=Thiomicrospira sp. R3 TaxID=3035472 RepID=UPI00259AFB2A|nr:alanine racemase [Thiomicrospira sp. R3]WFE68450.1 alanine racemase [Thiomicrospira sp. R3]